MIIKSYNVKSPTLSEEKEDALQRAFEQYRILDTPAEKSFDEITGLAAMICGVPRANIGLLDKDREWFKSHFGSDVTEIERRLSLTAHVVANPHSLTIIEDLAGDERFADHPVVAEFPYLRFFAAAPLVAENGTPIGSLCVCDDKPGKLSGIQQKTLEILAGQVMNLLKLKKKIGMLEGVQTKLENLNSELSRFAYVVAHDIKSPLRNIHSLAEIVMEDNKKILGDDSLELIQHIIDRSEAVNNLVNGILDYSVSGQDGLRPKMIHVKSFIQNVIQFVQPHEEMVIEANLHVHEIYIDPTGFHQILQNLVSNAVKYNDKPNGRVKISLRKTKQGEIELEVADNGPGIPEKYLESIFLPFQTFAGKDRFGKKGNGIGLATVKNIVERIGGMISVTSKEDGSGTIFIISIPEQKPT